MVRDKVWNPEKKVEHISILRYAEGISKYLVEYLESQTRSTRDIYGRGGNQDISKLRIKKSGGDYGFSHMGFVKNSAFSDAQLKNVGIIMSAGLASLFSTITS